MASLAILEDRGALQWRAAVRLAAVVAGLAMLAAVPAAHAQDAGELSKTLAIGVRCEEANALRDLSTNVAKVPAGAADVVTDALTTLAADDAACEPLRAAALSLVTESGTLAHAQAAAPNSARAIVEATLAEADRRAATMKFEVGPPPLNLSRGRRGGS